MTQTINELLGSVVQILLFTLIPFIWWLITARKKENFFSWIGLKKPVGDKKKILLPDGIKVVGTTNVEIKLNEGVVATLKVKVTAI